MPNRIDDDGFHRTRYQALRAEISQRFRDAFGTGIKTDVQSVFGQLISILTYSEDRIASAMQQLLTAYDPYAARGEALSRLATIMGTNRNRGFPPEVTLVITHNSELSIIDEDLRVTDSAGLEYKPLAQIVCDGSESTTARFIATRNSDYRAPAHTVTRITVPVAGVSAVDNPAIATAGQIYEPDVKLRRRLLLSSSQNSSTPEGIARVMSEVPGVTYARVLHNPTGTTDADGLKPHSVLPLVTGGHGNAIAEALITKAVPAGIDYVKGGEIPNLKMESGAWRDEANAKTYTAWFSRIIYTPVQINVSIKKLAGYDAPTHEAEIKSTIVARMKTINRVGKTIYASELYTPTLTNSTHYAIRDITLGETSSIYAACDFNERLVAKSSNIGISD
ncbi:baseplate J/gp47 family protein [Thiolapillus sp.]|uniref:baseplate J/gp47 family protein n=1 Tax=Thiolapillus sp. TaxID=2017437 RepID=UPI003AF8BBFF